MSRDIFSQRLDPYMIVKLKLKVVLLLSLSFWFLSLVSKNCGIIALCMQVKTTVGGVFSPSVNGMIFLENNILEKLFLNINDQISIMIA